MTNDEMTAYPTTAYDLLTPTEREAVDDYVQFVVAEQRAKRQPVRAALNLPIPNEYIRRSRQALYKPVLKAAVAERINEEADKYDISPDRAIHEYASLAFSDITDFMQKGLLGEPTLKSLDEIPPEKAGAIKSIECKPGHLGLTYKIVLHDKLPALRTLSDLMGMTAPDRPPVLTDYVRKELRDARDSSEAIPEAEYTELLEAVSNTKEQS